MRHIFILTPLFLLGSALASLAADPDDIAGRVVAEIAGESYELPLLESNISKDSDGAHALGGW